jgi:hypothetical protein
MADPTDDSERAFCEAVQRYAADEWSPAIPDQRMVIFEGKPHSIRDVCRRVSSNSNELPNASVLQLFGSMRVQHDKLREKFGRFPYYSTGAECLLRLMDEREQAYKERQARRNG